MKEVKFRKQKSKIIEKQEAFCKDESGFVTELSLFFKILELRKKNHY